MPEFDRPAIVKSVDVRSELAPKIRATYRRTEEDRRNLGMWLLQCKEECLHAGDDWLQWLEKETGIPHSTASLWMAAVQNSGQKTSTTSNVGNGGQDESGISNDDSDDSGQSDSQDDEADEPITVAIAEKPEANEPEILCDELDQELPEQAYPAFNQLPALRDIWARCDKLAREIEALAESPAGRTLHASSAASSVRAAKRTLRAGRPAMVCPYCRGAETKCKGCDGTGWVTETAWNSAPPEKREIIRAGKEANS